MEKRLVLKVLAAIRGAYAVLADYSSDYALEASTALATAAMELSSAALEDASPVQAEEPPPYLPGIELAWPPPFSAKNGVGQWVMGPRSDFALTVAPSWFVAHLRPQLRTLTKDEQAMGPYLAMRWLYELAGELANQAGVHLTVMHDAVARAIERDGQCRYWRRTTDNSVIPSFAHGGLRCQLLHGHAAEEHVFYTPAKLKAEEEPQCDHMRGPYGTVREGRCLLDLGHEGEHRFAEVFTGEGGSS